MTHFLVILVLYDLAKLEKFTKITFLKSQYMHIDLREKLNISFFERLFDYMDPQISITQPSKNLKTKNFILKGQAIPIV